MTVTFCARETEVVGLVAIGQWPRQADDDLTLHVTTCAACRDAVVVALALHGTADDDIRVPDASVVWQCAQRRARQEAVRVASRPVAAAQGIAAIGLVMLIGGGVAWLARAVSWPRALSGMNVDRISSWLAASGAMWASIADTVRDLPLGFTWLLPGAFIVVLLVVGIAFFLSTLVDLASDPPAR